MENKFRRRVKRHDELEIKVMNVMRPRTTRKHLPDRWVSFNDKIYPWDMKSNVFVEDNSHDEYFRLLDEGYRPFIVYRNKQDGIIRADFIDNLTWSGPFPATKRSTTGDDYYRIAGGRLLDDFLDGLQESTQDN